MTAQAPIVVLFWSAVAALGFGVLLASLFGRR